MDQTMMCCFYSCVGFSDVSLPKNLHGHKLFLRLALRLIMLT
jgi:hypothetical protein